MKYIEFRIKNFKGIKDLTIDLTKNPNGNVIPLVGLNESGKTTILEAINLFQKDIKGDEEYKLLHKEDSGNFTGFVEIKATLELDETDKENIRNFFKKRELQVKIPDLLVIGRAYYYKNAKFNFKFYAHYDNLSIKGKTQRKYNDIGKDNEELTDSLSIEIEKNIPKIIYFSDFLFDFPNKIYLENIETLTSEKERTIYAEYKKIIDDILHSINPEYSLNDFLTKLKGGASDDGQSAASEKIKEQISSTLNNKILSPWEAIFQGVKKTIVIGTGNDSTGYYLQIKVREEGNIFLIDERSLGFRWFFSFILFTEFRVSRSSESGENLFLFDEPASNLHESSQQKLLSIFKQLADKSKIIYSTHSPYLIDHVFILSCFIVRDIGRDANKNIDFIRNIQATPYRQFVANYPNEETHFKPILDVLEYVENPFEQTNNIVFFEGKNDYYTFKWVAEICLGLEFDFNFYPGAGVSKYENIFREYLAHNRSFIAIFDDDNAGTKYKSKYIKNISQELENNIFTLKDIDENFDGFVTEKLFTDDEKLDIQKILFPGLTSYKKGEFNRAIQELFIKKRVFKLSDQTKEKFTNIFDFIKDKLPNGTD